MPEIAETYASNYGEFCRIAAAYTKLYAQTSVADEMELGFTQSGLLELPRMNTRRDVATDATSSMITKFSNDGAAIDMAGPDGEKSTTELRVMLEETLNGMPRDAFGMHSTPSDRQRLRLMFYDESSPYRISPLGWDKLSIFLVTFAATIEDAEDDSSSTDDDELLRKVSDAGASATAFLASDMRIDPSRII